METRDRRVRRGFTLAELLIVVAIIAILAAIAIPIFNVTLEKSRRAVDVANARSLVSMLNLMVASGEIEIPDTSPSNENYPGVWVVVCKDKDSCPGGYKKADNNLYVEGGLFCGADTGVKINKVASSNWNKKNLELEKAVKQCFGNQELASHSNIDVMVDGIGGWDWYIVQVYRDKVDKQIHTIVFSGEKGKDSGLNNNITKTTNIKRFMQAFVG